MQLHLCFYIFIGGCLWVTLTFWPAAFLIPQGPAYWKSCGFKMAGLFWGVFWFAAIKSDNIHFIDLIPFRLRPLVFKKTVDLLLILLIKLFTWRHLHLFYHTLYSSHFYQSALFYFIKAFTASGFFPLFYRPCVFSVAVNCSHFTVKWFANEPGMEKVIF